MDFVWSVRLRGDVARVRWSSSRRPSKVRQKCDNDDDDDDDVVGDEVDGFC
jgi:hypothetical protein